MTDKEKQGKSSRRKFLLVLLLFVYIVIPIVLIGQIVKIYPSSGTTDLRKLNILLVAYSTLLCTFLNNFRYLFWFFGTEDYKEEGSYYWVRFFLFDTFIPAGIVILITIIALVNYLYVNLPAFIYLVIGLIFGFGLPLVFFPPHVVQSKLAGDSTTDAPPPPKKKKN